LYTENSISTRKVCFIHDDFDYDTHEYGLNTYEIDLKMQSVIYTHNVTHECDPHTLECDFHTQSVISTRKNVISIRTNVITIRTSVISTRAIVIYTHIV
jgi:hypothetical protein